MILDYMLDHSPAILAAVSVAALVALGVLGLASRGSRKRGPLPRR